MLGPPVPASRLLISSQPLSHRPDARAVLELVKGQLECRWHRALGQWGPQSCRQFRPSFSNLTVLLEHTTALSFLWSYSLCQQQQWASHQDVRPSACTGRSPGLLPVIPWHESAHCGRRAQSGLWPYVTFPRAAHGHSPLRLANVGSWEPEEQLETLLLERWVPSLPCFSAGN